MALINLPFYPTKKAKKGSSMGDAEVDLSEKRLWPKILFRELTGLLTKDTVRLNLASNNIDANCQAFLVSIFEDPECKIQSLNLSDTHLTIENANKIFLSLSGKNLVELYLDDMIIKENSISVLAGVLESLPYLQVLSFRGSELSSQSISILAESLPKAQSLHYLCLEGNEIYAKGIHFLADVIRSTNIISLEIADNNIWSEGTTYLLKHLYASTESSYFGLSYLDISYNAVDFNELALFVKNSPNLRGLAASGCKGSKEKIPFLFDVIKESRIETLIFDGVNENEKPITWPQVTDTVFSNHFLFNKLFELILSSHLTDIRVGFLDLEQIYQIMVANITRELTITIQDFGRTGNIWVIELPNRILQAPDRDFIWNAPLPLEGSGQSGSIIKSTFCNGEKIKSLQILMCSPADSTVIPFFNSLMGFEKLDLLKITRPVSTESSPARPDWLTQRTLEGLKDLLKKTEIEEISLSESEFLQTDFAGFFFKIMNIDNAVTKLKRLTIGMGGQHPQPLAPSKTAANFPSEVHEHDGIKQLVDFLGRCSLESLCLEGHVSFVDARRIMEGLSGNKSLKSIEFDTNYVDNYRLNPDPPIPDVSIKAAEMFIMALIDAAKANQTLEVVKFQMITELMFAMGEIPDLWKEALDVLEKNKKANS